MIVAVSVVKGVKQSTRILYDGLFPRNVAEAASFVSFKRHRAIEAN